jgi:hypothetical protein
LASAETLLIHKDIELLQKLLKFKNPSTQLTNVHENTYAIGKGRNPTGYWKLLKF